MPSASPSPLRVAIIGGGPGGRKSISHIKYNKNIMPHFQVNLEYRMKRNALELIEIIESITMYPQIKISIL